MLECTNHRKPFFSPGTHQPRASTEAPSLRTRSTCLTLRRYPCRARHSPKQEIYRSHPSAWAVASSFPPALMPAGGSVCIAYSATGDVTSGSFTSFSYSLFGNNGSNTYTTSGVALGGASVLLGSGSLVSGTATFGAQTQFPKLSAYLQHNSGSCRRIFSAPNPFYNTLFLDVTHVPNMVILSGSNYLIGGGGGSADFGNSVPTPAPAALPLFATGIGAIGLLGWRRKRKALIADPRNEL